MVLVRKQVVIISNLLQLRSLRVLFTVDFFMFVDLLVVIVSICYLTEIKRPQVSTKLERNKADMKTQWGQSLVDSTNSSKKSLLWAYFWWLFGGVFGK